MVKIRIQSFNENSDVFTIAAFGFSPEDEAQDPDYCKSAPDFDDFEIPSVLLPAFIRKYGEPAELVGQVFEVELP